MRSRSRPALERQRRLVRRAIARGSFCALATSSAANRPLVVGVLYAAVEEVLYISTVGTSVKVRNIRDNDRVALCIPVRRYPVGPPFAVQFQGRAEVLRIDDPEIAGLLRAGRLKRITAHGELEDPGSRILKVTPGPRVATYGLGVPLHELLRDPTQGSRSVRMA